MKSIPTPLKAIALLACLVLASCDEFTDGAYTGSYSDRGKWSIQYTGTVDIETDNGIIHIYPRQTQNSNGDILVMGNAHFAVHGCSTIKAIRGAEVDVYNCAKVKALPNTKVRVYGVATIYATSADLVEVHNGSRVQVIDPKSSGTGATERDLMPPPQRKQ